MGGQGGAVLLLTYILWYTLSLCSVLKIVFFPVCLLFLTFPYLFRFFVCISSVFCLCISLFPLSSISVSVTYIFYLCLCDLSLLFESLIMMICSSISLSARVLRLAIFNLMRIFSYKNLNANFDLPSLQDRQEQYVG